MCQICQKSATRMVSKVKILRALNRLESKLSNAPRISFISHFLASISAFEILLFSEISVFLTATNLGKDRNSNDRVSKIFRLWLLIGYEREHSIDQSFYLTGLGKKHHRSFQRVPYKGFLLKMSDITKRCHN